MPLSIEINDKHIAHLIEFYVEKQKLMRNDIIKLEREIKEINAIITQLKQSSRTQFSATIQPLPGKEIYSDKWPWIRKIKFALDQSKRPLSTKEVVDFLTDYEPDFISGRRRAIASVSSILSVKSGEEVIKSTSETGEFVYGLPEWDIPKPNETFGTTIEMDDLPF